MAKPANQFSNLSTGA